MSQFFWCAFLYYTAIHTPYKIQLIDEKLLKRELKQPIFFVVL